MQTMHNFFAIILIIASGAYCDDELKLVHIVYRHGDRTPCNLFPTDTKNRASTWYNGLGELTPDGMRRHYQLGKWFRQRYTVNEFLNNTFDQSQIYVRSTDYNRTIMSAMSNLAGLFPPQGEQHWNSQINWQPIPVHATDKSIDYVHRLGHIGWMGKPCPAVDELYANEVETNAKVKLLYRKWRPFLSFLSTKTGVDLSTGFKNLNRVADSIIVEHDTTIIALLRTLQVPVDYLTIPPYAAAVIFEQFLSSNGQWTVKVSYKTDVGVDDGGGRPVELEIGKCSEPCSLDKFIKRSQPFITEDWYAECGLTQSSAAASATGPASNLRKRKRIPKKKEKKRKKSRRNSSK